MAKYDLFFLLPTRRRIPLSTAFSFCLKKIDDLVVPAFGDSMNEAKHNHDTRDHEYHAVSFEYRNAQLVQSASMNKAWLYRSLRSQIQVTSEHKLQPQTGHTQSNNRVPTQHIQEMASTLDSYAGRALRIMPENSSKSPILSSALLKELFAVGSADT
ncbi:ribonuclease PH [Striga asiatica]|uniref:Ribonuclease PH n=1 Tax=Striga asiatica TaxID=4170 RepID=A0A5A7PGZ6_STRAF|nr:ribonuclease PH [Striga asiatica]